jgi:MFS family permease
MTRLRSTPDSASASSEKRFSMDFWMFLIGQTISNVGSSFTIFLLPLLVFKLTGSALNLAFITAAEYAPYLLFGLIIGAWVDRVDRKRLMIYTDITQSLIICTVPLLAALGLLSVWWLYVVGFVSSTLWICFNTAEFGAVPSLVHKDNLVAANGYLQASYSTAAVVGPLLAGLLVALVPIPPVLLFDAVSFLLSALLLKLISTRFNADRVDQRRFGDLRRDVAEGLSFVLGHPILRNICLMMCLVNCIGFTVYTQLVLFAKERLVASDTQVGFLYAAGSVGMIALALAASPLRKHVSFSKVAIGTLMVGGSLIVLLASTSWYWAAVLLWASIWGLVVLFDINANSLWQQIVPDRLLGRVQSVVWVLSWSAIPLGAFIGGVAIEQTQDITLVYRTIGVMIFLIAFAFSFTALGRAEHYLPQEAADETKTKG